MITIKLPYKSTDKFQSKLLDLRKQYSNIVRYSYNRYCDGNTQKQILFDCNNKLNNVNSLSGFMKICAILEGNQIWNRFNRKENSVQVIFGGKFNFIQRLKNKITKEKFQLKRLLPLNIQGDKLYRGNRHCELNIIDENFIEFKLNKNEHFILHLPNLKNNIKKDLFKLQQLNEIKHGEIGYCYSIKLDEQYIYISFEEFKTEHQIDLLDNRYLGIDLNPTNIGISICEYDKNNEHKILKTIQFDFTKIIENIYNCKKASNDKYTIYWNNKLNYEILNISKKIHNLSKAFNCKYIFIEELNFKHEKKEFSKSLNRLVKNLWKRNKFINNLNKRCNINGQKLIEINSAYSSVIGNLQYDYVDSVNASIEIGRRGYEVKILRNKDKFYPIVWFKNSIQHQWKEMGIMIPNSWKMIYLKLKNLKIRYRVSLDKCLHKFNVFSLNNKKSMIGLYCFSI